MGMLRHVARDLAVAALAMAGVAALYLVIFSAGGALIRAFRF